MTTLLAFDDFTGTNGAAWSAAWTTTGSVDIQSNQGRLLTPASVYGIGGSAYRSGMAAAVDAEILYSFTTPAALNGETMYFATALRSNGATVNYAPSNGYFLEISPSTAGGSYVAILRGNGTGTADVLTSTTSVVWAASTTYNIRFRVVGANLLGKVWAASGSEPTAWTVSASDSVHTAAGKLLFSAASGGTATARDVRVDNLTVTDGTIDAATATLFTPSPSVAIGQSVSAPDAAIGAYAPPPVVLGSITVTSPAAALTTAAPPPKGLDPGTPWQHWKAAANARAAAPATVLLLGDSYTEGQGASTRANRYADKLQTQVRAGLPTAGVTGGLGFLPPYYNIYGPDSTWTPYTSRSGTHSNQYDVGGLGSRVDYMSAAAVTTYTVTGTAVDVWWERGFGTLSVSVDGGAGTNINTSGAAGFTGSTRISLGAAGSHTVAVTATTASHFAGITVYNGDETSAVRFVEAGLTAASTTTHAGGGQVWGAAAPELVVIAGLVTNDALNNVYTPAQSAANLIALIAEVRASIPNPVSVAVVQWADFQAYTGTLAPWADYLAAVQGVVDADPSLAYVLLPALAGGNVASDGLHPTDAGHTSIATALAPYIIAGPTASPPAATGTVLAPPPDVAADAVINVVAAAAGVGAPPPAPAVGVTAAAPAAVTVTDTAVPAIGGGTSIAAGSATTALAAPAPALSWDAAVAALPALLTVDAAVAVLSLGLRYSSWSGSAWLPVAPLVWDGSSWRDDIKVTVTAPT